MQVLELSTITTHRHRIQPCSAFTGENLVTGLDWLVGDVAARIYYGSKRVQVEAEARFATLGAETPHEEGSVRLTT
jgi:ADP-ribosylation factor-like protein 2